MTHTQSVGIVLFPFLAGLTLLAVLSLSSALAQDTNPDSGECPPVVICEPCICPVCDDTDAPTPEAGSAPSPAQVQAVQQAMDAIRAVEALPPLPAE